MAEVGAVPRPEIIIEPPRGWLKLDLKELWEYRDLLFILVRRDWLARYQQTLLGPLWHLLQPVLTAGIFVLFFSRIAGISTDGVPPPLFYFSGLLAWNYFSQSIIVASGTFQNNQHLFSKVWFPRIVVPVAAITSNLASFALQLIPFAGFAIYYAVTAGAFVPTWRLAFLPLAVLQVAGISLGVGLWMAASTAKYRDLMHLNQFVVQLWMFASPIIYPIPDKWRWLEFINPMAIPIETLRWCLLAHGTITPTMAGVSAAWIVVLIGTGLIAFQNASRSAVDTV
jgi:lipopolysaccharide transport system permease protein